MCPYYLLSEFEGKKTNNEPFPLPGPRVLVSLAEDDARVPASSVAKWVSRLRRLRRGSGSGGNDVVVEVLRGCGHAEGLRSEGDIERNSREAAFLVDATERWERRT